MTWKEAIKYCETHECSNCITYNKPDCRTEYDKTILHAPCFINLVDENLRSEIYNESLVTTEEETFNYEQTTS